MAPVSKAYDIIVYGATGFTGDLVVKYLHSVSDGIKFAVAGRSKSKIEEGLKKASIEAPIIVADSSDEAALLTMVKQTKLVISLVGPYMARGQKLVKACAENGVHYVDLAGEPHFAAKMIKEHARSAVSTRAILIHACGFDSVPSDLCTFLAVQRLKNIAGSSTKAGSVVSAFKIHGTISGGTLSTFKESVNDPEARKISANPYALSPIPGKHKPKPIIAKSISFAGVKTWLAFWVMSGTNSAIVRRSWGILESAAPSSRVLAYGDEFAYEEGMAVGGPVSTVITSFAILMGIISFVLLPPVRWAVNRWGVQPGQGPSLDLQKNGWFKVSTVAKSADGKHEAQVVMKGKGDPGYAATAKMITESALAIIKDYDRLPPLAHQGGPLTPATALGTVLVERLEATNFFSFSYTSPDAKDK